MRVNLVTSAGISAGTDMALRLVARLNSDKLARQTERRMEYTPASYVAEAPKQARADAYPASARVTDRVILSVGSGPHTEHPDVIT